MAEQWYYTRQGQRVGPVSPGQLKQLATAGELAADDLVWKQGMASWTPAKDIKGLMQAVAASVQSPEAPPPIPATPSEALSSVALWNPQYIGLAGFLLTWGFGAWLLAQNWKSLGNPARAKRAMYWLWGLLGLGAINLFVPLVAILYVPAFLAWIFVEHGSQAKHVKATVGDRFVHRTWGKPVGIALGCSVAYMVLAFGVMSGEHPNVTLIKTGHLGAYPTVPVGKAVDAFFSSPRWEAVQGKDGNHYVNIRGGATFQGKPVRVALQFQVDQAAKTFQVNAMEVNDLPQNGLMKVGLMSKIFEDYKP